MNHTLNAIVFQENQNFVAPQICSKETWNIPFLELRPCFSNFKFNNSFV